MFRQHLWGCKVNINFPNFATIAPKFFTKEGIILLGYRLEVQQLSYRVVASESLAVGNDVACRARAYAGQSHEGERVGTIEVHEFFGDGG